MKISALGVSVIPKREKGKVTGSAKEPIFGKYVGESIAALQESIIEAERRFDRTNSEYEQINQMARGKSPSGCSSNV